MYCASCGKIVEPGERFCSECGKPVEEVEVIKKTFSPSALKSIIIIGVVLVAIIVLVAVLLSIRTSGVHSPPEAVEGPQELIIGQEFIYDGKKIALTKYEIVPANTTKNLWVYLYVENIDDVPHNHTYETSFVIHHKRSVEFPLFSGFGLSLEKGRKHYSTGEYRELNPGEVCEGWISNYISADWKAEDIEIHFKPISYSHTSCIWKLEK